jgi:tRNA (guanine-N7-)-methyltransferase
MQSAPLSNTASLIYRPASWVERLPLLAMFSPPEPERRAPARLVRAAPDRAEREVGAPPLEVELGSGDGSFLAQWAAALPERNFLGVERLLGRLRKLDRKARRAGLANVRLLRIEAGYFLEYLLPVACVHALHVYFPDPWPKRKHRKHRLVNERFPELAAKILVPQGRVYLRTDDAGYFAQMQEVFALDKRFAACDTPQELASVSTDFERDFQSRGINTHRAAYRLE